jgi:hypothetical protein
VYALLRRGLVQARKDSSRYYSAVARTLVDSVLEEVTG